MSLQFKVGPLRVDFGLSGFKFGPLRVDFGHWGLEFGPLEVNFLVHFGVLDSFSDLLDSILGLRGVNFRPL